MPNAPKTFVHLHNHTEYSLVDDGTYPIAGEPGEPLMWSDVDFERGIVSVNSPTPEEEPKPKLRGESQHTRLQDERFEGDARGGWQTSLWQLQAVSWQLLQGHAEPVVYRGDGGAVGKGMGYSCAIRKGSRTRAAEQPPRYGPTRRVPEFYDRRDDVPLKIGEDRRGRDVFLSPNAFLKDKPKVGAPLVGETPDNSPDSQARVTPMRRMERSIDSGFDDDGERGNDEDMSDVSVAEVAAWRSGSEAGLRRDDPARRLLFERQIVPPGKQAELRRAWRWIEAEVAAYPWTFARAEFGAAPVQRWIYGISKIKSVLRGLVDDLPDPWRLVERIAEGRSEREIAKEFGVSRYRVQVLRGEMAFAGWAGGLPEISTTQP